MISFRGLTSVNFFRFFYSFYRLAWFIAVGLATGCSNTLFVTNNLAETWNNSKWQGPRHIGVSTLNIDSIIVYLEVDPSGLPAIRSMEGEVYRKGMISLGIFTDFSKEDLVDTTSIRLFYPLNAEGKSRIEIARMKAPAGRDYLLWIKPEGQPASFYPVQRGSFQADAEWLLTNEKNEPIVNSEDLLNIPFFIHLNATQSREVFVRRYQLNPCLPLPPFVTSGDRCLYPLSTMGVLSLHKGMTGPVILPGGGIYLLQADTSLPGAKIISIYDEKTLQWVTRNALRFITTPEEWAELQQGRKEPWDFWDSVAGSTQRAVQLSSAFRNRVAEACRLFTEDVPGALTDRGMIYLVFGAPATVVTSMKTETWTYAPSENLPTLVFDFDLSITRHGIRVYQLRRNTAWRQAWMQAVERWRR